jgi:hypothetical protein
MGRVTVMGRGNGSFFLFSCSAINFSCFLVWVVGFRRSGTRLQNPWREWVLRRNLSGNGLGLRGGEGLNSARQRCSYPNLYQPPPYRRPFSLLFCLSDLLLAAPFSLDSNRRLRLHWQRLSPVLRLLS